MMTAARACVPSLRFAAARPRTWVSFAPVIARDVAKASWRSAEPPARARSWAKDVDRIPLPLASVSKHCTQLIESEDRCWVLLVQQHGELNLLKVSLREAD